MPDPAPGHAAHDALLVAAHAAGDAEGADLGRAAALVASCPECARLHRDLRALAAALASAPAPARPRDFGITPARAAALRRPRGWRRLLAPLAGARSAAGPLAASLAALGLAGLLLGGGLRLPLGGAGTATVASSGALTGSAGGSTSTDSLPGGFGLTAPTRSAALETPALPTDGSRDLATSAPPDPTGTAATPIDRAEAIAIARAARPDYAREEVLDVRLGAFAAIGDGFAPVAGPIPAPDAPVWRIDLGWLLGPLDGQGVFVVIDAADGHVIQVVDWIA